jgi:hypothetical protein
MFDDASTATPHGANVSHAITCLAWVFPSLGFSVTIVPGRCGSVTLRGLTTMRLPDGALAITIGERSAVCEPSIVC